MFSFIVGWNCYHIGNSLQKTQPNHILRRYLNAGGEKGRHLPVRTEFVQKAGKKYLEIEKGKE